MSAYRDDHEAALARIDALELELAAARRPIAGDESARPLSHERRIASLLACGAAVALGLLIAQAGHRSEWPRPDPGAAPRLRACMDQIRDPRPPRWSAGTCRDTFRLAADDPRLPVDARLRLAEIASLDWHLADAMSWNDAEAVAGLSRARAQAIAGVDTEDTCEVVPERCAR